MKLVIALGGNALLKRGESMDVHVQRQNIAVACEAIAPLVSEHRIILTHGNGPQVGLLALQASALDVVAPYPLDVLGAESEGMIGYLIEQGILNAVPGCRTANLITSTRVNGEDPAFNDPTKFIGPVYDQEHAKQMSKKHGWIIKADGAHFRRVVPSPTPVEILNLSAIRTLSDSSHLVICTGGGGVPVVQHGNGQFEGVEAVIDKDRASALLAEQLRADALLLLTDVDAVYVHWGTDRSTAMRTLRVDEANTHQFAAGSMGPKIEAACQFATNTGQRAGIGALRDVAAILSGDAGTTIKAN